MHTKAIDPPAAASSHKWLVMAAVGMSTFLATVDGSIVNVALPTMVDRLGTDFPTIQWVVVGYLLTMATLLLGVGRLADMRGKKPIFIAGLVIFILGSLLCGLSTSVYWLIGFRVLQAVGAAMALAIGPAIITETFPPSERGKALGIGGTIVSLGSITGPTMGGLIINALDWHWIFFVNVPIGIVGVLMALRFIPATRPAGRQSFDFGGAATLFVSMLSLLLGLTVGQGLGFTDPRVLALFAGFALFLILFAIIEQRVAQPMVDLTMFRNALFSVSLITGFVTFVAAAGAFLLLPFYLQNVLGYGTQQIGILMSIVPITMGATAPISGSLSDRLGSRTITVVGDGGAGPGVLQHQHAIDGHQRAGRRAAAVAARPGHGHLPVAEQQRHHGLSAARAAGHRLELHGFDAHVRPDDRHGADRRGVGDERHTTGRRAAAAGRDDGAARYPGRGDPQHFPAGDGHGRSGVAADDLGLPRGAPPASCAGDREYDYDYDYVYVYVDVDVDVVVVVDE